MNQYQCVFLSEVPSVIPEMVKAGHSLWGDLSPDFTPDVRERFYREVSCNAKSGVQVLVVLDEENNFAGFALINTFDVPGREDIPSWLSEIYIAPKYRSLGLGSWLLSQAEAEALAMGYETLYLFCESAHNFFEGAHWRHLEDTSYNGTPGTIMVKDIAEQAQKAVSQTN